MLWHAKQLQHYKIQKDQQRSQFSGIVCTQSQTISSKKMTIVEKEGKKKKTPFCFATTTNPFPKYTPFHFSRPQIHKRGIQN